MPKYVSDATLLPHILPISAQPCPAPRRYHLLKPEYIHHRIRELQRSFRMRIILCHVDTEDAVEPLAQVRGLLNVVDVRPGLADLFQALGGVTKVLTRCFRCSNFDIWAATPFKT